MKTDQEMEFTKKFDKCPACGHSERLFGTIVAGLKERGLTDPNQDGCWEVISGRMISPEKEAKVNIGETVPGFSFGTDICSNCGCIYAPILQRLTIKKTPPPPEIHLPNRAERRRGVGIPQFNNPAMS